MTNAPGGRLAAAAAIVAVLFGLLTFATGARVLLGADPGYRVFMPLLGFNTTMGVVYVVVGVLAWRQPMPATRGALAVFAVNLVVLAIVGALYRPDGPIAPTSLQAMALRTVVWLLLWGALAWSLRRSGAGAT